MHTDALTDRQREILAAIAALAAAGEKITLRSVQARAGGSYSTILPLLAQYRAGDHRSDVQLPARFLDAARALYDSASDDARARAERALRDVIDSATHELDAAREQIDTLRAQLDDARAHAQQQAAAIAAATAAAAAAAAAIEKMGYGAPRTDRPVLHVPKKSQ